MRLQTRSHRNKLMECDGDALISAKFIQHNYIMSQRVKPVAY